MALRLKCIGKVQGVFYRASTKTKADDLDVKGWVRNESDGSVLIHAEGPDSSLDFLIAWCRQGPQFAQVKEVLVDEVPDENCESFSIRY